MNESTQIADSQPRIERGKSVAYEIRGTRPEGAIDGPGSPARELTWSPGRTLNHGQYEIRACLGVGGMGEVYEALDRTLARMVAIKVLGRGSDSSQLRREAQAIAACRHPGVVAVHALLSEDGLEYLVMERVYGVSLEQLIRQRRASRSPLTMPELEELLLTLAEAVAGIHRVGIVHRDLKPANILVAPGGRVVVIDFGICAVEAAFGPTPHIAGTLQYLAPETINGTTRPGLAHLVDLYAFGVIAFELITGRVPFDGESPRALMYQHVNAAVPDIVALRPDASHALAAIVYELLSKDPSDRPEAMNAVTWSLRALRGDSVMRQRAGAFSVLVVDDDASARLMTELLVRRVVPDATIVVVSDGESAVRSATQRPPHLLLLDLDLPGMNGLDVCLSLRGTRAAAQTAIVLISGRARAHDVELLRQLGVTRFLSKGPSLARELSSAIASIASVRTTHVAR